MKIDFTKEEIWALIGVLGGIKEMDEHEESAGEKLNAAYLKIRRKLASKEGQL